MTTPIEQRIITGQLWEEYCDTLKRAGQQLLRPETPHTTFDQAEGMRYLSRLVRAGLEMMVEGADADFPTFVIPSHETIKIGADNPDNLYQTARINGRNEYRIRGSRGTVPTLNFATKKGGYEKAGSKLEGTGLLSTQEMQVNADGSFEILVSAQRPASGNWLPMEETSHMLLVRQTFHDRRKEKAAEFSIERVGHGGAPAPLDPARFAASLMAAGHYTENTARLFCDWAALFKQEHHNTIPLGNQAMFQAAGGDPNIAYHHGYWEFGEDEAMVIDAVVPPCEFWNFQVDNYWMESLDYRHHRIHVNSHGARYNPDGSVTIVIAHRDPGHPNWLTTAGHALGTSLFRVIGAGSATAKIATRLVKLSDIPHMPKEQCA
ncbi:DUF1214 domain-containing protein [Denitratisoma oestradiolicum]|uniref:DUF1214 domain-containing protein n=1 Tax=Denitratisoma oestradiolicum TaxID=311182 RepID=A0A6S6YSQ3_9PROT|nr:DUF1214 domain-containing protein [Denitratisoma oestradiolicum]TWO81684.1 hypothetical protein CBW56_02960 [Denitratisoma oestradiolicum]CAB1370632.1 conserved protein of unknown function [Denitratisoma oestradiolicum]